MQVSRYHPLLVTPHWLTAALIIGALGLGFFVLAPFRGRERAELAARTLKDAPAG